MPDYILSGILQKTLKIPIIKKILNSSDFYNLSSVRDLVFHVQEHQFTIKKIITLIETAGLNFCGFQFSNLAILQKFENEFGKASDIYDLLKWEAFEKRTLIHLLLCVIFGVKSL